MWPRRSHKLAPLTILMSIKIKSKWTQVEKYAFDGIKQIVACNTLLTYPDLNEIFKINTDDSAFQVGVFVRHKGKPISF